MAVFQTERENTDQSLDSERSKTNRSLADAKEKAELRTDMGVQAERTESDAATKLGREVADRIKYRAQGSQSAEGYAHDISINDERARADSAVALERASIDTAIVDEREIKSAIEIKLLNQEREKTDKNLLVERDETDTVVLKSSIQLSGKDECLASVNEDLRAPVKAISDAMTALIKDSSKIKFDSGTKVILEAAKQNADVALKLINDILQAKEQASHL